LTGDDRETQAWLEVDDHARISHLSALYAGQ
jgi:hypothetical protein